MALEMVQELKLGAHNVIPMLRIVALLVLVRAMRGILGLATLGLVLMVHSDVQHVHAERLMLVGFSATYVRLVLTSLTLPQWVIMRV